MNKKEIAEIKKAICNKDGSLVAIKTCLVNSEKNKLLTENNNFLSLPEEEMFKYLDIFKKALTGKIGKVLFPVPLQNGDKERELLDYRENFDAFCDSIINSYDFVGNYLIICGYGIYDYPGRHSDGTYDEEADYTYEYMIAAICPVELATPALSYIEGTIKERIRDWVVGAPKDAVLYPAFTDRTSDVHNLLYFAKNSKNTQEKLINTLAGTKRPNSADEDKDLFIKALNNDEGECGFNAIQEFTTNIYEKIEQDIENDQTYISKDKFGDMMKISGLNDKQIDTFKNSYENTDSICVNNFVNGNKSVIAGHDFTLNINQNRFDDVQIKTIDGRACVVFPLTSSDIAVNGITVKATTK